MFSWNFKNLSKKYTSSISYNFFKKKHRKNPIKISMKFITCKFKKKIKEKF